MTRIEHIRETIYNVSPYASQNTTAEVARSLGIWWQREALNCGMMGVLASLRDLAGWLALEVTAGRADAGDLNTLRTYTNNLADVMEAELDATNALASRRA